MHAVTARCKISIIFNNIFEIEIRRLDKLCACTDFPTQDQNAVNDCAWYHRSPIYVIEWWSMMINNASHCTQQLIKQLKPSGSFAAESFWEVRKLNSTYWTPWWRQICPIIRSNQAWGPPFISIHFHLAALVTQSTRCCELHCSSGCGAQKGASRCILT